EVVAQVRAARQARAARAARCRVRGDDAVALADTPDAGADRRDGARELVAEDRGDLRNHDRVATTERLDVRPAGERRVDPEHQLAGLRLGHRELLRAEVARAVEHHRPHGVTYTLSASRRRIRSTPRSRPGSVTRWVTSPSTDTSPAAIGSHPTTAAPACRRSWTKRQPIEPRPTTTTVSPGATRARRTERRQHASGSTNDAASSVTWRGTRNSA